MNSILDNLIDILDAHLALGSRIPPVLTVVQPPLDERNSVPELALVHVLAEHKLFDRPRDVQDVLQNLQHARVLLVLRGTVPLEEHVIPVGLHDVHFGIARHAFVPHAPLHEGDKLIEVPSPSDHLGGHQLPEIMLEETLQN